MHAEIKGALDEICEGDLDIKIPVRTTDELGVMAQTVNDMTDRLKTSIEEERAQERIKNELITNISHDLRTPLTSMIGYLELIHAAKPEDQEQIFHYSDIALRQGSDLKTLIECLFDYTKFSNGYVKLDQININLSELLEQVILGFIPIFQENEMEYRISFPNQRINIMADPILLTRVFDNLIRNAVFYGKDGKYVDIKLEQKKEYASVAVMNYGNTISPTDLPHIFERLYRVQPSGAKDGGLGIGLAITKSIVDLHKGMIHVSSAEGTTIFEVNLPLES